MKKIFLTLTTLGIFMNVSFAGPIERIDDCNGDASCVGKVLVQVIRNNAQTNSGGASMYFRCELEKSKVNGRAGTINGEGMSRDEAISAIIGGCKGVYSYYEQTNCIHLAPTAKCEVERI